MSLQIDSTAIPASDSVELTLPDDILSYSFDADGITVTEVQTDRIHFHVKPVERLGFFNICANYADGTIGEDTIYFFRDYDMTFVSNFTLDDAFHKGMQFLLEQGTITTYEYEQKYAELTQNYISTFDINSTGHTPVDMETAEALTITTSTTSNTISVSGYAYWKPSSNTVLPLKYAKISFLELTNLGYNELDNVYTDLNGYFSFEIDISDLFLPVGDTSLCIRILPESTTINVYNPGTYAYYEYSLPGAPSIGEEYSIGGLLLQNSEDMTFYRLLYIHQCMLVGERFAKAMGATLPNETVNVIYPFTFSDTGAYSWYGTIQIGEDLYDYHDTIIHEYAHYVQQTLGFYGSNLLEVVINGPTHKMYDDQLTQNVTKEYALELVWSESWATVFSAIAQQYYPEYSSGISNWGNFTHNGEDFETPQLDDITCEFQEIAIIAFLWDLYDDGTTTGTTEPHDRISLSARNWWTYTTKDNAYHLTDFIHVIETYYPSIMDEVGDIMSAYRISVSDLTITNLNSVSDIVTPKLTWRNNGSQQYANDTFQVFFYDAYGNELASSELILRPNANPEDIVEFDVPFALWKEVVGNYAGTYTIQICVKSYFVTVSPDSGPYPSRFIPITINKPAEVWTMSTSSRYAERKIRLDQGQYCDFNITFFTAGTKLIQTFGTKDTKLELYALDGTLLASNDDGGYGLNALISYEVQASMQYTVRVKFYSAQAYGTTKLAIIPARYLKSHDSATINSYEAIYHVQNALPVEFGAYTEQDYVMVFRYIVPTSGDYTFTIASDLDTYMYVIDPRSSELLVVNVNYNDDSGEGMNPLITTHLDAGVPYLIIFSAYNPHNPTVAGGSTLTISITEA